jgi:polysaccharide pyruvyl transferase WcaK-like protein
VRILVHGHHGVGNVGDDAMLRDAMGRLRAHWPEAQITLSAGPCIDARWCAEHSIRVVPRSRSAMLRELMAHDALVLIGGTWLHSAQGTYKYDVVGIYLSALMLLANLAGLQTALVAIGIGPFKRRVGRWIARTVCRQADFISVRDPASWDWLRAQRLPKTQIARCADPAYGLSPSGHPRKPHRLGISALPYHAGYTKHPTGDSGLVAALSEAVSDWLARSSSHEVVLLPFNNKPGPDSDLQILEPVLRRHVATGRITLAGYSPDPYRMLDEVAVCGAMISMRYHSVLFGHLSGTPMLVIDYHGKTTSLLDEIGFPAAARIPVEEVAPGTLRAPIAALIRAPASHLAAHGRHTFDDMLSSMLPKDGFQS